MLTLPAPDTLARKSNIGILKKYGGIESELAEIRGSISDEASRPAPFILE